MKRIPRRIFTAEFKRVAIKVVTEQGLTFTEASKKLDIATKSLRAWMDQLERGKLKTSLGASKLTPDQHRSDRGGQYCNAAYRSLQASYGMETSMSRKGSCWDNAPMESFFGTIKTESLHHYRFKTREQAQQVVFEYIEVFYNRIRRHAKIGNQIPSEFALQCYATAV